MCPGGPPITTGCIGICCMYYVCMYVLLLLILLFNQYNETEYVEVRASLTGRRRATSRTSGIWHSRRSYLTNEHNRTRDRSTGSPSKHRSILMPLHCPRRNHRATLCRNFYKTTCILRMGVSSSKNGRTLSPSRPPLDPTLRHLAPTLRSSPSTVPSRRHACVCCSLGFRRRWWSSSQLVDR